MNLISSYFISVSLNDAPEPWQMGFQEAATPAMEGITNLQMTLWLLLFL